ncbi:MAG: hypothetical protein SGARI_008304 [Bacillariaceae sp.]
MNATFLALDGKQTIKIDILQCTEGSRCGRICCSEIGVGWVVLEIKWQLLQGKRDIVVAQGKDKLRDGGSIGCADMCSSDVGENALLKQMAPKLAKDIVKALP